MAWVTQAEAARLLGVTPRVVRRHTDGLLYYKAARDNGGRVEYSTDLLAYGWLNSATWNSQNAGLMDRLDRLVRAGRALGDDDAEGA